MKKQTKRKLIYFLIIIFVILIFFLIYFFFFKDLEKDKKDLTDTDFPEDQTDQPDKDFFPDIETPEEDTFTQDEIKDEEKDEEGFFKDEFIFQEPEIKTSILIPENNFYDQQKDVEENAIFLKTLSGIEGSDETEQIKNIEEEINFLDFFENTFEIKEHSQTQKDILEIFSVVDSHEEVTFETLTGFENAILNKEISDEDAEVLKFFYEDLLRISKGINLLEVEESLENDKKELSLVYENLSKSLVKILETENRNTEQNKDFLNELFFYTENAVKLSEILVKLDGIFLSF